MKLFKITLSLSAFWLGLVFIIGSCKQKLPYQYEEISEELELNFAFSLKRGIQDKNGIIFFVEADICLLP
ncbi:hypothetical protein GXP67_15100 [Rhodocytophaga rosea]|uniref:Lipoprotein n=1 Tax=Rhodocytophaga rosea TaxID=2704465 RepID=A0A6C0GJN6_9BACT|nr:hypothetical protein [Rhodocytophaga rosea]QHT67872.1 hypothetical protein GXP67_15100 [Rhodocytophaga rosea]